jgi:hypothetical protein
MHDALIYLSSVKQDDEDIHCRLHSKPCLKGRLLFCVMTELACSSPKLNLASVDGGTTCYCHLSVVTTII